MKIATMFSLNQSPDPFDQIQEDERLEQSQQLFMNKEDDVEMEVYQTGEPAYEKSSQVNLEWIDYKRLKHIQKQNKMLANMQSITKWNNCTKIPRQQPQNNISKVSKKQDKKECLKKSKQLMLRNEKWLKEKDKKLFQKSRSQFLRMKQMCYFSPKIF